MTDTPLLLLRTCSAQLEQPLHVESDLARSLIGPQDLLACARCPCRKVGQGSGIGGDGLTTWPTQTVMISWLMRTTGIGQGSPFRSSTLSA
jgi:hypothetical protein